MLEVVVVGNRGCDYIAASGVKGVTISWRSIAIDASSPFQYPNICFFPQSQNEYCSLKVWGRLYSFNKENSCTSYQKGRSEKQCRDGCLLAFPSHCKVEEEAMLLTYWREQEKTRQC